jgi:hypothetical protein
MLCYFIYQFPKSKPTMTSSINKVEATRFILRQAKEQEAAWTKSDSEIRDLKAQIAKEGTDSNKSFARMKRIQWLDTERSKSIQDINALSDLVQELWCEEDFEPDLDYVEHAQQIRNRPASRRDSARRSSYMEMKTLVEKIAL